MATAAKLGCVLAAAVALPGAAAELPAFLPNGWRRLLPDPGGAAEQRRLVDHCSAALNGKLYVHGGKNSDGSGGTATLWVYDIAAPRVTPIDPATGAAWPPSRYKCKMAADPSNGVIYLFGGKTKVPEKQEFTDFWAYDTAAGTWTELPSGGDNGPVAESMDGDMAVFGDVVAIAGADDGLHGKTFRYSISQRAWLPFVEDGATALNKPTLLASGMTGYLVGGYNAAGDYADDLLTIDFSAEPPFWRQLPQSGEVPRNDGMKGGALPDGALVVLSSTGAVHRLDVATGAWSILPPACGAPLPRDDFAGAVIDGLLVIMGGTYGELKYAGDVQAFSPLKRGNPLPCLGAVSGQYVELFPDPAGVSEDLRVVDHCSAVYRDKLYVFGGKSSETGSGGDARLKVYDLTTRSLRSIEPPAGAAWPPSRYKCKMDCDAAAGKLYLFGGKTKVPEKVEFTDFWVFDAAAERWTELPSGGENGPVAESMDGDLAVIGGQVLIAGADDGLHGKTFRYSIAQGQWLSFVEDGATALNKPTLVRVGNRGFLIGGYNAAGAYVENLLMIDLSAEPPFWRQLPQSGAVPRNDGMKGGALSDGTVVVLNPAGTVHHLDPAAGAWSIIPAACGTVPRDDMAGDVIDDYLVIFGGAVEGEKYTGDMLAFSPYDRGGQGGCASWLSGPPGRWQKILEQNETGVMDHCSAGLGRKLYVIGGKDAEASGGNSSRLLRVYDVRRKTVSFVTPPADSPWPPGRYKCKMAADESSGKLYLFGGKTKVPEKQEFTDFWEYDTQSGAWTELPHGGVNGPVAESMDGDLAVAAGQVVIAGADDGLHGKTFRYSIARGAWLPFVEDGATALNKPLLVTVGSKGYLIGGYDATGVVSKSLLTIDFSAAAPFWQQEEQGGSLPVNDALKGGASTDGKTITLYSSAGSLHILDLATNNWTAKASGCNWIPTRDDYAGEMLGGVLVVMGGSNDATKYLGDLWAFVPGEHSATCGGSGGGDGGEAGEAYQGIPLGRPVKKLRILEQGYRSDGDNFNQVVLKNSGICFATRRFFVALTDQDQGVAVFPDSLQPQAGLVLPVSTAPYNRHTGLSCSTASDRLYVLHLRREVQANRTELAFVSEYSRAGEQLALLATLPTGLPSACTRGAKLCSWGLAQYSNGGEQYLLALRQDPSPAGPLGNGTIYALRREGGRYVVARELLTPRAMTDYTGLSVDAQGRVLITSLQDSRILVAQLAQGAELAFDPSVAAFFDPPRHPSGAHAHCNIVGVAWITDATGTAVQDDEGYFRLATASGSRHGATQGPDCVSEELSIHIWQLPHDYATISRDDAVQRTIVTPAPTASSGSFTERMEAATQPWVFLGGHPSEGRLDHCAAALGGMMYVFGGQDAVGGLSSDLLTFNISHLVWGAAPRPLGALWPPPRRRGVMVSDEGRRALYLLGGLFSDGLQESSLYDFWQYSAVTASWTQLPSYKNGERYAPGPLQGTSFRAASTVQHIVVVGSSEGAQTSWMVFDKQAGAWLAPFADTQLAVEAAAVAAIEPEVVIVVGGIRTTRGSFLPRQTLRLSTAGSPDHWAWQSVAASATAPSGDHFTLCGIGQGAAALLGDPRGKGPLGAVGGVATVNQGLSRWAEVNRSAQWLELRSGFSAVEHDGRLVVFGGAVGTGRQAVITGEVWGYSPRKCPADCNGRGTCELGNCLNCQGSSGVACEYLDPEGVDWVFIIILAAAGLCVLFLVFGIFLWRSTAEMRKYRKLYDTARVAEDMAGQIALMDLEGMEYLRAIEHPTATQKAFLSIVDTLLQYRAYLPQSILQGVRSDDEEEEEVTPGSPGSASPWNRATSVRFSTSSASGRGSIMSPTSPRSIMSPAAQRALSSDKRGSAVIAGRTKGVTELGITRKDCSYVSVAGQGLAGAVAKLSDADFTRNHAAMLHHILMGCNTHRGIVEPFDGDRVCASFGALGRSMQHSLQACSFIHRMTLTTDGDPAVVELPAAGFSIQLFAGGCRGKAAVGNLGTQSARKFSVIGFSSLTAKRLELAAPGLKSTCLWATLGAKGNEVNKFYMLHVGRATIDRRPVQLMMPKLAVCSDTDEWMYQLANAESQHPFHKVNELFDNYYSQGTLDSAELETMLGVPALSPAPEIMKALAGRAAGGIEIALAAPPLVPSALYVDVLKQQSKAP
eukprot:TRINITY_DN32_c0_g1_i1.p1 TRINITY_DN32_c0_g1~~TRINITY_DN32_c0_g1_i1.p1  ORF type:complete len:2197 (+),score=547.74 TRINITY_DN32_c0_g1_i1:110-6592(+)